MRSFCILADMFAFILIVASILGSFQEISSETVGRSSKSVFRIVHGSPVIPAEIPYQASLQSKISNNHICGGLIITEYFVLTAAHCILSERPYYRYEAKHVRVVAGTTDLYYPAVIHDVFRAILHEDYVAASWKNDIALLEVDRPFRFTKHVAPARLPQSHEQYDLDNTIAVVTGYGKTESVKQSPTLLRANVHLVNEWQCKAAYARWPEYPVRSTNICAKGIDDKQGFCNGDSGGPLSINGTAIGVVSWSMGSGCYKNGYIQVYTRIASYVNWISNHIQRKMTCSFVANDRLLRHEF